MTRRTSRLIRNFWPQIKLFFQEIAIAVLLGGGLGFIFNDLFFGLILGLAFGLASYFVQK